MYGDERGERLKMTLLTLYMYKQFSNNPIYNDFSSVILKILEMSDHISQ